jgi:hypothetical protein
MMSVVQPVTPALSGALHMLEARYHIVACKIYIDPKTGKKHFSGLPEGWAEKGQTREEILDAFAHGANAYMIACGPSHLVVADLDVSARKGTNGLKTWFDAGKPRGGLVVRTPRGGEHHYFSDDTGGQAGNLQEILPGVDIRGVGGGVIGPGSLDGAYKIVESGPFPPWSVTGLHLRMPRSRARKHQQQPSKPGFFNTITKGAARRDIENKLTEVAEHAAHGWGPFREFGNFRNTLIRASFTLGGYVGSEFLDYDSAEKALIDAIRMAGHEPNEDDLRWIEQGLEDGVESPLWVSEEVITVRHEPVKRPFDERDFWKARPMLQHIYNFAESRDISPWPVFGCVMAQICAATPHNVVLPPIVGSYGSLNLFFALVGESGDGKGGAMGIAAEAVNTANGENYDLHTLGSGQAIAHAFVTRRKDPVSKELVLERIANSALFTLEEVDLLASHAAMQGSTVLAELRRLYMGERLGHLYVDPTKHTPVEAHTYRAAFVTGVQPAQAGVLLNDATGGTPQRFIWLPVLSPPPEYPPVEPPGAWVWKPPAWAPDPAPAFFDTSGTYWAADKPRITMAVPQCAVRAIKAARLARRQGGGDPLDGHLLLCQLKLAANLAIADSRAEVTEEDWQLADAVMQKSNRTRQQVIEALARKEKTRNEARGKAEATRAVLVDDAREEAAVQRVARAVIKHLSASKEGVMAAQLRRKIKYEDRGRLETALIMLTDTGQVRSEKIVSVKGEGIRYSLG